jgi:hypothetical protein
MALKFDLLLLCTKRRLFSARCDAVTFHLLNKISMFAEIALLEPRCSSPKAIDLRSKKLDFHESVVTRSLQLNRS